MSQISITVPAYDRRLLAAAIVFLTTAHAEAPAEVDMVVGTVESATKRIEGLESAVGTLSNVVHQPAEGTTLVHHSSQEQAPAVKPELIDADSVFNNSPAPEAPAAPSAPVAPIEPVYEMTEKGNLPRAAYVGWSDDQLVEHGYMRLVKPAATDAGAPPPPTAPAAPQASNQSAGSVAPTTTQTAANGATANDAVGSDGIPWDARIHTKTKSKNNDGTYRFSPGLDPALKERVIAELRTSGSAAPTAIPQTAPANADPMAELINGINAKILAKQISLPDVNRQINAVGLVNNISGLTLQNLKAHPHLIAACHKELLGG